MSARPAGTPVPILLVEDSPGDVRLTQEALRDGRIANELHVVGDGEAALDFLHRRGAFADAPRPGIVLLDLNLPRKGGIEVLEEIKSDRELASIPVVILTTSSAEADILRSYQLRANAFISKPVRPEEFIDAIRSLGSFWLGIVQLPAG